MLVDADTHVASQKGEKRISCDTLIARMDACKVSRALIWLYPNQREDEPCDVDAGNAYVYQSCQRHPGRFLPVGWVDPRRYSLPAIRDQLRRMKETYGFRGVKLNGAQNFYDLADDALVLPVIECIAQEGLFLAFHSDEGCNTHPDKVAAIAGRFPDTPVLLVHMGRRACQAAIAAAQAHPRITLIASGMPDLEPVATAVRLLGPHRICWGSDTPFGDISQTLSRFLDVCGALPQADRDALTGGNILAFYEGNPSVR